MSGKKPLQVAKAGAFIPNFWFGNSGMISIQDKAQEAADSTFSTQASCNAVLD
jgi:hypothetical protein